MPSHNETSQFNLEAVNDVRAMPTDTDSLISRGAWLGMAYLQASHGDLQQLMRLFHLTLPKEIQNDIRLEMTVFSLATGAEVLEGVLREKFADYSADAVSQFKDVLVEDGALGRLATIVPHRVEQIIDAFVQYGNAEERSQQFWDRLRGCGLNDSLDRRAAELASFEETVLRGTALCLALDALTISQSKIEDDHKSFLTRLLPSPKEDTK